MQKYRKSLAKTLALKLVEEYFHFLNWLFSSWHAEPINIAQLLAQVGFILFNYNYRTSAR